MFGAVGARKRREQCVCILQVVDEGLDRVLVVEDDIDFEPRFREGLAEVMKEVEVLTPTWDLM